MREMLQLPDTHRIGIVPGSDTGAFEMAMWTMLGARPVTALAWESFGEGWVTDAVKQLKLDPTVIRADYGELPDLDQVDWSNDVLFTWNGTTSGVRVPDGDWIADDREGLTFADATSAVFAYDICRGTRSMSRPSRWQKVLGGEGGARRADPRPARGRAAGELHARPGRCPRSSASCPRASSTEGIFKGETINTPVDARGRGRDLGARMGEVGRRARRACMARSDANAAALDRIVAGARLARPSRRGSGDPVEDVASA